MHIADGLQRTAVDNVFRDLGRMKAGAGEVPGEGICGLRADPGRAIRLRPGRGEAIGADRAIR